MSSAGVFAGQYQPVPETGAGDDRCQSVRDSVFHAGAVNTRQVTTRNAPTVINAAFNYRNFWDGRASHWFNGATMHGPRDPPAGVWELKDGQVVKTRILLANASLASQAVAPPLDNREMACAGRRFPALGRKLLQRRPLERQAVHPEDSVLAELRHASGQGLNATYAELIRKSFAPRYWSAQVDFGKPTEPGAVWTQMESNFAFFFALAIQLYEATLIADETPFDAPRGPDGLPVGYTEAQKRGHTLFNKAECDFCHAGPVFTAAAQPQLHSELKPGQPPKLVDLRVVNIDRSTKRAYIPLMDVGFANTSVTPSAADIGAGANDPWGRPLAFAEQYRTTLLHPETSMVDPIQVTAADFSFHFNLRFQPDELASPAAGPVYDYGQPADAFVPKAAIAVAELAKPQQGRLAVASRGTFKIPTLRNIELTGPYMHNGGMKSLEEVIEFYDRGGNAENAGHFGTFVFPQHFTPEEKRDLLAFLLTLTDERVRWERAPFDHPSLAVPHGHTDPAANASGPNAADLILQIPAVGRSGRTPQQGPLQAFKDYL